MLARIRFQPVTNRETWFERLELRDQTGQLVDLSDIDLKIEVWAQPCGPRVLWAYRDPLGVQTGDGLAWAYPDGRIEWRFEPERLRSLSEGLYDVNAVYIQDGFTTQLFTGEIAIENGGITV